MSRTSLLISPVAKHASSAAMTALVVYLRPSRMPKALRRGLLATNTAGSVTAMLVGSSTAVGRSTQPAPLADRVGANADSIGDVSTALASLAGSVTLLTSKPALKLDGSLERALLRRGVGHPRLLMAVGAAGAVVAVGIITDRLTRAAERKAAELQRRDEQERIAPGVKVNPPPATR